MCYNLKALPLKGLMTSPTLSAVVQRSTSLYYRAGTSSKEYHLYMCRHADGTYSVHAEYGRRGSPTQRHVKTPARVTHGEALSLYLDAETEKRRKGYTDLSSLRPPASIPGAVAVASDPRPSALAKAFEGYLAGAPDVDDASKAALKALEARLGPAKLSKLPSEPLRVLGAVLGDIACSSQDYVDDALAAVSEALSKPSIDTAGLFARLSAQACEVVERTRTATFPADTREQLLALALEPARAAVAP